MLPFRSSLTTSRDHALGGAKQNPNPSNNSESLLTFTDMSSLLMVSVLVLFNNDFWAHSVRNLTFGINEETLLTQNTNQTALLKPLCELTPFHGASSSAVSEHTPNRCPLRLAGLFYRLNAFLDDWNMNNTAAFRLNIAVFLANQAALTSHLEDILPWSPDTGREIFTAPGATVSKPVIGLPAQVTLSLIVGVKVVGLLWLRWFIYTWSVWTRSLDAMAVARVAGQLDASLLPPFANVAPQEQEKLAPVDGLVGALSSPGVGEGATGSHVELVEKNLDRSTVGKRVTISIVSTAPVGGQTTVLGLGAPGLITKRGVQKAPASRQGAGDA
ncbi:uncharacterized protein EKO05_0011219 [Ascochyta rabiei]|uniref:uncharacterized protein n=1 Tax=Didymella rabiei TaxID=5454 RepID=UPI00220DA5E1|nr:uncharacterized protein EKO05_0011219 [Ascochyta rabiei]UPX21013.1 hypothetical protein EKO05_0011219 [Ascochyta rabiei]